ncbi:winged helix-turn-helix domain-containing protein [Enterobacteriaceae bacterium H4N4]|uniref:Winged helix-turn-helix domain-containing protein n=1 Tax=Silvania confinis TaxID=2926470 RepID=A0A9J6QIW6_9ENTR|nr:winged helix-turn-helix domain-containing protein [Silvania confinis]MCU6669302.1 winged helix-turn-helix domain-containing protein [Silvania confinis]
MVFNLFIINDEVIFDANSYELKSLKNVGEVIILNVPTSRCLHLLIEKKDEVVSRDNFMEQVWQAKGVVVSQNTFYQNISLLRKSLKNIGLTEDIIVTVRRKGFILAADTRIQPLENEKVTLRDDSLCHGVAVTSQLIVTDSPHASSSETAKTPLGNQTKLPKWLILLLIIFTVLEITSFIINWLGG